MLIGYARVSTQDQNLELQREAFATALNVFVMSFSLRGLNHTARDTLFEGKVKPGLVTVPHPKRDIPLPALPSIYRQAGWPWR